MMKQVTDLKQMLEAAAERYAGNTAIVCGDSRISYAELDESANRLANAFIGMGARKGARIAMLMANSPEFVSTYFGIIKAGAIPVPLDVRYKVDELGLVLDSCEPRILVAESELLEPVVPALSRFKTIERVIDVDARFEGRFPSYAEVLASSSTVKPDVEISPDDIGVISYTSGPTNRPHGTVLDHRSLVFEAFVSGDGFRQTEQDRMMMFALPMYHMFGLASAMLGSIHRGSTVIIVPGTGRSITSFLETIEREKGTMYLGVPYIYALAINVAEREGLRYDTSSVRLWGSGGATLTVDIIDKFKHYYGADILDIWGLTESVSHITHHPAGDPRKLGSSGKALPGWEIRATDDGHNILPPNQTGEIVVRGPIMKGYYNNPGDTTRVIKDGWLQTGDLGYVDQDGYLYLTGMKKDMIILKGQNVWPADIEEVLRSHDKVAGVAVVGIPDRLRGEIVGAVVQLKNGASATEQEIRNFCQSRMADYKLPKKVFITEWLREKDEESKKKPEDYLTEVPSLLPYLNREQGLL
jgi:long-chain acyl-CoA synthetase